MIKTQDSNTWQHWVFMWCPVFFYAEQLFPSEIRSYLFNWKPNGKPNAKISFRKDNEGKIFIYFKQWVYIWWHVIVLLHRELSRENRGGGEKASTRLWVPTEQKSCSLNTNPNNTSDPGENENKSGRMSHSVVPRWPSQETATSTPPWLAATWICRWQRIVALTDGICRPASADPVRLRSHILPRCLPLTWGDPWPPLLSTGSMRTFSSSMIPAADTSRGKYFSILVQYLFQRNEKKRGPVVLTTLRFK